MMKYRLPCSTIVEICTLPPPQSSVMMQFYRISSCKFASPNRLSRKSYEEFSCKTTLSVKDETTYHNERRCSGGVETVASVHGGV